MNKITLPQLKKELKTYNTEELISIIVDCYKSSADVKKYIHMMLEPGDTENELYEDAKKKIKVQFYPERGEPKLKFAEARKAITEFSKLSNNQVKIIELMIYYVELGVQFTNDYGDMYDAYYSSMESMFQSAMNRIDDLGKYLLFRDKLKAIIRNVEDIGWGFEEALVEIYYSVASDYEEDED